MTHIHIPYPGNPISADDVSFKGGKINVTVTPHNFYAARELLAQVALHTSWDGYEDVPWYERYEDEILHAVRVGGS